jgi:hypothetical protein
LISLLRAAGGPLDTHFFGPRLYAFIAFKVGSRIFIPRVENPKGVLLSWLWPADHFLSLVLCF